MRVTCRKRVHWPSWHSCWAQSPSRWLPRLTCPTSELLQLHCPQHLPRAKQAQSESRPQLYSYCCPSCYTPNVCKIVLRRALAPAEISLTGRRVLVELRPQGKDVPMLHILHSGFNYLATSVESRKQLILIYCDDNLHSICQPLSDVCL